MAAALFRRGTGLCCIHRELCRVVWRPQTALFSSKPSDRKQPRRTHIKKAKPQPAVDVAKLLEQLFSQRRPGTAPPAGKAQPTKASSMSTKPPTTSSMKGSTSNVPPLLKTEPTVSVVPAASSFKQGDGVPTKTTSAHNTAPLSPQPKSASPTNPKTSYSSETPQQTPLNSLIQGFAADSVSNVAVPPVNTTPASLGSEAALVDVETATEPVELKAATVLPLSAHMVEKNVDVSYFSAAAVEPLIETTTASPVEPSLSPVETIEVRGAVVEDPVEPTVDVPAEEVQTKGTDSGVVVASHITKEEPLIETIESPAEASHFPVETLESKAAVVGGPVEPTIDATVNTAAGVVDISHTATVEPLLETTVEHLVEAGTSPLEIRTAECPVEPTVDATLDAPAQAVQTNSTDSAPVNLSHITEEEPLIETTINASVEASNSPLETLEKRAAVAEGSAETDSTDSGVVNVSHSAKEEIIEPAVETNTSPLESRAAVLEGTVESTIENEAADSLSHAALIQNAQESAPLPLKNEVEPTLESTVELSAGSVTVEEGVNDSEQMTLESVTLHVVKVLVESLKTDELHQTQFVLDEKAEKQLQELFVQTGAQYEAAAETENSSEDEREVLTKALSKWDSLSEDLQELEGESGTLVNELLCHVPTVLSKAPGTVETSSAPDPAVGANGEALNMEEKGTDAEAMTLESITLAKVKAEVGGLETEVLLETRNALEKEAEVLAKDEKMEVKATIEDVAVFEDTTEAEILALDCISEATDAIEAETSIMLEAMFGSEQGPRQPSDTLLFDRKLERQDETIDQEEEKESGEQEGGVLEAMTLESVTLAEIEASLGTLENESLSETTDYLEKEAEILAGERRVEGGVLSEETTEALKMESLSLPEGDTLSEALQTDTLMEELLFSVPGHVRGVTESQIGQEDVSVNILDATVATGSVDVDSVAAVTDGFPASSVLKEVQLGQEVEEEGAQTEALGNEDGKGTHTDLDPVQRLFLEKIREYNNMRRLNEGLLEVEPDYKRYLSEETAKLQRLYGGGDLSSFPEFTFTEPNTDQDSK